MEFKYHVLFILFFLILGCSTAYDPEMKFPSESLEGGKIPATQKPYEIKGVSYMPIPSAKGFTQIGIASWYGKKFHGRKTANGEKYNMFAMTAAHKTLPIGVWVKVHNLENNKEAVVRINDRGPFMKGRIIDLSFAAAEKVGILDSGTGKVRITSLGRKEKYSKEKFGSLRFVPVDYWKGSFTVQVGSFKYKENAENYKKRLSESYQDTYIERYKDSRGAFYRVKIGRFTDLKDAMKFSEKIIEQGVRGAFAVAE